MTSNWRQSPWTGSSSRLASNSERPDSLKRACSDGKNTYLRIFLMLATVTNQDINTPECIHGNVVQNPTRFGNPASHIC